MKKPQFVRTLLSAIAVSLCALLLQSNALAHCDTLDGPVVKDARAALETKDVTPALKWVPESREAKVKAAFKKALKGKTAGAQTKENADMEFFELLVRIHREGEGAKFSGVKPALTPPEPAVFAADEAIENGSANALISGLTDAVLNGVNERFNRVVETKAHMNDSIEAGREYVAAYVELTHYVEGLHKSASDVNDHDIEAKLSQHKNHHKH